MPTGRAVRPTQDRVREAVFNVMRERIPDSKVLDLYAGSGAFGAEALSRGAASSVSIDNNSGCVKTIKINLSSLGYGPERAQAFKKDGLAAISDFKKNGIFFDIVFMDPPFYKDCAKNSLIKIGACDILTENSFVIAEHFVKDIMPRETGPLTLFKERRYGDTVVSFYRRKQ